MVDYVGRPHDVTRGRIKEVMVNYHPARHRAVESLVERMPHAYFIVFDGPSLDELTDMTQRHLVSIPRQYGDAATPLCTALVENFSHGPRTHELYSALIKEKNALEEVLAGNSPRCRMLRDFLEAAALVHYRLNMNVPVVQGRTAQQIKEKFPDRVEIVKMSYPLHEFATDIVLPLEKDGQKLIVKMPRSIVSGHDIMGNLEFDVDGQINSAVWDKLGYARAEGPQIDGLAGGNIVANSRNIFIGMNPLNEVSRYMSPRKIEEELEKITGSLTRHVYDDGEEIMEHIDMLLMPINDEEIFIADPAMVERFLKKRAARDRHLNVPFMKWHRRTRRQLQEEGLRPVSVPFWVMETQQGIPYTLTYCNNLQEEDRIYVPKRGENVEPKVASAGKVLDEEFTAIAGRYKRIVQIGGFDFPSSWHDDSALRCLANVTHRE